MSLMDPKSLETAFLAPGTLTLADCASRIEQASDLSTVRRRDLRSGLQRLAAALERPLAAVPADPTWLRPRIRQVIPAALGLSEKSWSNIQSNARAALVQCGIVERRTRRLNDLSPLWQPLWNSVLATRNQSLLPALGRFVRCLNSLQVAPEDVCTEHLTQYQKALAVNELRRSPEEAVRQAAYAWNLAARLLADWPKHRLDVPSRDRRYVLPLTAFPESFARDLEGFIQKLERPDLSKDEGLKRPLRPATVRHRRAQVLRFASAIVLAGADPSDIRGLADLVEPTRARQGIRWLLARGKDGEVSPGVSDMAIMLKTLVRHHVHCSKEDRDAIIKLSRQLAVAPAKGLTAKNRERLLPFEDEEALHQLATLPARLFAQASGAAGLKAALKREEAVAIAILLNCPIRRRNLVSLHLDQNLRSLKNGRVFLCFDASEVKNRRPIDFELPAAVLALLQEHVATRSPLLCPPGTPWLFPRRDGAKHMDPSGLSNRIAARIRKETGLEVHAHLFRHFAAKIWLDANPGQYEALRRILGHAELSSTLNAYAGFEAGAATRLYADLIAKAQGSLG